MSLLEVENGILDIDNLVEVVHANAVDKGFWDVRSDEDMPIRIALIHSEVSEALEAHREDQGEEALVEELADIVIRAADLAGGFKLDLAAALTTVWQWKMVVRTPGSVPTQLAGIHMAVSDILHSYYSGSRPPAIAVRLAVVLLSTEDLAKSCGLDLLSAIQAKVEKNAGRPRLHGKQY